VGADVTPEPPAARKWPTTLEVVVIAIVGALISVVSVLTQCSQ